LKVLEDKDLEMLKQGYNEPLVKIFEANYITCVSHVKRLCHCQDEDAEDLVMDAIVVLKEKILIGAYENSNLESFLISVARNKWRNRQSKYGRIVFVDPLDTQHLIESQPEEKNQEANDQERELRVIKEAIAKTTGKCGQLLRRNLYDGIPLELLINELGYSNYNVIKSSKSRCLKKLRAYISKVLEKSNG